MNITIKDIKNLSNHSKESQVYTSDLETKVSKNWKGSLGELLSLKELGYGDKVLIMTKLAPVEMKQVWASHVPSGPEALERVVALINEKGI